MQQTLQGTDQQRLKAGLAADDKRHIIDNPEDLVTLHAPARSHRTLAGEIALRNSGYVAPPIAPGDGPAPECAAPRLFSPAGTAR